MKIQTRQRDSVFSVERDSARVPLFSDVGLSRLDRLILVREVKPMTSSLVGRMSDVLRRSQLDDSQKRFCSAENRALRLLAPAGSGKTYALLWRCLNHCELARTDKPRFLIFTFTRAARQELRDRLRNDPVFRSMVGNVEITTLNSWGFRRLRTRVHGLRLLTKGGDFYFCVNNTLQPVWQNHERMKAVLTSTRIGSLPGSSTPITMVGRFAFARHSFQTRRSGRSWRRRWEQSA